MMLSMRTVNASNRSFLPHFYVVIDFRYDSFRNHEKAKGSRVKLNSIMTNFVFTFSHLSVRFSKNFECHLSVGKFQGVLFKWGVSIS